MKINKKILSVISVVAVTVVVVCNVGNSKRNTGLSDLSLANVEALAQWENGKYYWDCWLGSDDMSPNYIVYTDCRDCLSRSGQHFWAFNQCAFWN